ncbi:hypothetical protein JYU34_003468 [Plutella xylostella]|uniref:RNA-directed DNA polymerase n=1 Tax=Plutella xylostella TaxID=51655 RepID=A0ABQ7R041_PLUXY|nr:hypothetical protein JYU34_003468 [Plutella xylostella]
MCALTVGVHSGLYIVYAVHLLLTGQMEDEDAVPYSPTRTSRSGSVRSAILAPRAPLVSQDRAKRRMCGEERDEESSLRERGSSRAGVDHLRSRSRVRGPPCADMDQLRSRSRDRGPSRAAMDHRRSRSRDCDPSRVGVDHRHSRSRGRGISRAGGNHGRSRSRDSGTSRTGVDYRRSRSRGPGSSRAGGNHRRSRDRDCGPSRAGVDHRRSRSRGPGSSRAGGNHRRSRDRDCGPSRAGVDYRRSRSRSPRSSRAGGNHRRSRGRDSCPSRAGVNHARSRSHDPGSPCAGEDHCRSRCRERSPSRSGVNHRSRRRDHGPSRADVNRNSEELLTSKSEGLSQLLSLLKSVNRNDTFDRLSSVHNTVPEFDPSKKEQTMSMWLHKVNECSSIYGWSEKQIVHYALPKLRGVAQRWYEGLSSVLFTWEEWQSKLLQAFPSDENYGQMLSDMLAKRARYTDSLEDYFYDKVALINRCGISGKRAVECILHGIDDRSVRLGAEAVQFDDPNKLLPYLRNAKAARPNGDRKLVKGPIPKNSDLQTRPVSRAVRCLNCKKDGHTVSECRLPIKKCGKCSRVGHETEQCYAKTVAAPDKTVMKISDCIETIEELPKRIKDVSKKFNKVALINGVTFDAFIDFGSECTMMKLSEFRKIYSEYDTTNLPLLKGFGNSVVQAIGKRQVQVLIDSVAADVELIVVPDNAMHVPLLVGQTYTEQPHIVITKTSDYLEIAQPIDLEASHSKVHLFSKTDYVISGLTIIDVYASPSYTGDVYLDETGPRFKNGAQYTVLSGLFSLDKNGVGQIVINNQSTVPLVLEKDFLIIRGREAREEVVSKVLNVRAHSDDSLEAVDASALNIDESLSPENRTRLLTLLQKYRRCIAANLSELGCTSAGEMSIELHDPQPVVYRPYRLAIKEKEKVRDMITDLLDNDVIRPSTSAYASPIVLVRKKSGEFRLCIDYRALNKKTIKENYPMPLIDDQLDILAGNQFYTTLDLASGYYQIGIRESDKYKTAFVTPDGHFEFNRMPFGLANAPATFQRIMNQVLGTARHKEALAYLDDVIIPSKDIEEGMARLESVLELFLNAGLTLNLSKCFFFGRKVDYLGFEVSAEGIRPGSRKIEAVERFPTPENQHNVRQFLGLASFFRRFVPGFSVIAKPMTQLLKKDAKWVWGPEQETAFRSLQKALAEKPTLALYNPQAETELHTDACKIGVAGILLQRDRENVLKPIAYFSRQTTPEEQNYSSYDLETLAVVSSLQKFRVYLIGVPFTIVTDCNSLRATFQKRDMLPRVARWWEQMQEYNFCIEYRPGKSMAHVDALSRNPILGSPPISYDVLTVNDSNWLVTVQDADDEVQRIIGILNNSELTDVVDIKTNYKVKNGKLFRITPQGDRWVVPKGVRWQVVKQNHDDIGHFALDKTLEKISSNYWFPKMRHFIKKYVNSCLECAYSKSSGGKRPGLLHPIEKVNTPFDTIHTDHVGPFVRSSKGNIYILVLIDAFTRYIYLKPVKNTKSSTSIRVFREYFGIFGVPRRVISDRGTSFTSTPFKKFMREKGIKHVLNAVATPRANGQVERYNKTVVDSLTAKCVGSAENKWDDHLPDVQWGINNTLNKGINRTPSEALFGIRLTGSTEAPLVTELGPDVTDTSGHQSLDEIREDISHHVRTNQEAQKIYYDKKRSPAIKYKVGDLVRVERHVPATGTSKKLTPKFQGPYKITHVLDFDRYQIADTPLTQKGNRRYSNVVAVDKIKPWLNFRRPHDSSSSDESDD